MELINWDITKASSSYASLAGILAGFIFATICYILYSNPTNIKSEKTDENSRDSTLVWLITAFFSLLISSFLFSVISGQDQTVKETNKISVIPYTLGVIATFLFVLASFQLLLGLLWFLSQHDVEYKVSRIARDVFYLLMPLGLALLRSGFNDFEWAKANKQPHSDITSIASSYLSVVITLMALYFIAFVKTKYSKYSSVNLSLKTFSPARISLFLVLFIAIIFSIIADSSDALFANLTTGGWVIPTFVILGLILVGYLFSMPSIPSKSIPASTNGKHENEAIQDEGAKEANLVTTVTAKTNADQSIQ